jgi:hypothetical protein
VREPADQPTQHQTDLGRERNVGDDADDDAEGQANYRADCDGGSDRQAPQMIHHLLPQPGGFEGSLPVNQVRADDLSVAHGEDTPNLSIDIRAAGSASAAIPNQRDDVLARVDDLVDSDFELFPSIGEIGPGAHCLPPHLVCTRIRKPGSAENDLAVVGKQLPSPAPVASFPVVHEPADDLDVLLRHRPRSISARRNPRRAGGEALVGAIEGSIESPGSRSPYGLPFTFRSFETAGLQTWRWLAVARSTFLRARA